MNALQTQIQTAFAAMLMLLTGLTLTLVSCKEKQPIIIDKPETPGEKIKDKVDDGLDRRPNEKIRDTIENVDEAAKDTKKNIEESVN